MEINKMTDKQENKLDLIVTELESNQLESKDVQRVFERNQLAQIFNEHHELSKRDIIKFLHTCQVTGANPLLNQIYLMGHYDKTKGRKVGTIVYSYHFLLEKASISPNWTGVSVKSEVEEVFNDISGEYEKQTVATASTEIKGFKIEAKAYFKECYNARNHLWKSNRHDMLTKNAVARCLRLAYPGVTKGMIIREEFNHKETIDVENIADIATDILSPKEEAPIKIEIKKVSNRDKCKELWRR